MRSFGKCLDTILFWVAVTVLTVGTLLLVTAKGTAQGSMVRPRIVQIVNRPSNIESYVILDDWGQFYIMQYKDGDNYEVRPLYTHHVDGRSTPIR